MRFSSLSSSHFASSQALCKGYISSYSSDTCCLGNGGFFSADRPHLKERDGFQSRQGHADCIRMSTRSASGRFGQRKVCSPVRLLPLAALNAAEFRRLQEESEKDEDEEDDDLCPVECVKEFRTDAELSHVFEVAKRMDALVIVDFYRTACGSCKYIEKGFVKLCKGAGDDQAPIIFLKHNVMDEYEEQSEVAERLKIKVVPLFHFYKDGQLLEAFPTREKTKIFEAICKYVSPRTKDLETNS